MGPKEPGVRLDELVACVGPANLDVAQAIKTKGPSELAAAQAVGELSTRPV